MASFSRKTGIVGALVIAGVLVVGAYAISGPGLSFFTQTANAESTQDLLKAYAKKDSVGDGIPDWVRALGPLKSAASSTTSTTSVQGVLDSIPGQVPAENTLTAQFSQDFMQSYVDASQGQQLSPTDEQTLLTNLLIDFNAKGSTLLASQYTLVDIHTSTNISVSKYAGEVEHVISQNDVPDVQRDVLTLAQALIENNDDSSRPQLMKLSASYAAISSELATSPVPPPLAGDHLALIQSFDTASRITKYIATYEADPIATMSAISAYKPTADATLKAFGDIAQAILATGEPAPGEPGASIVNIARSSQETSSSQ